MITGVVSSLIASIILIITAFLFNWFGLKNKIKNLCKYRIVNKEQIQKEKENMEKIIKDNKIRITELLASSQYEKYKYFLHELYLKDISKEFTLIFWENIINELLIYGKKLNKTEHDIKKEISLPLSSIYLYFKKYELSCEYVILHLEDNNWTPICLKDVLPYVKEPQKIINILKLKLNDTKVYYADRESILEELETIKTLNLNVII